MIYQKIILYEKQPSGSLRTLWEDCWGERHWRDATPFEESIHDLPPGLEVIGWQHVDETLYGRDKGERLIRDSTHSGYIDPHAYRNQEEEVDMPSGPYSQGPELTLEGYYAFMKREME